MATTSSPASPAIVIGAAGYKLWTRYEDQQRFSAAKTFMVAQQAADAGQSAQASAMFAKLAKSGPGGYSTVAKLAQANTLLMSNRARRRGRALQIHRRKGPPRASAMSRACAPPGPRSKPPRAPNWKRCSRRSRCRPAGGASWRARCSPIATITPALSSKRAANTRRSPRIREHRKACAPRQRDGDIHQDRRRTRFRYRAASRPCSRHRCNSPKANPRHERASVPYRRGLGRRSPSLRLLHARHCRRPLRHHDAQIGAEGRTHLGHVARPVAAGGPDAQRYSGRPAASLSQRRMGAARRLLLQRSLSSGSFGPAAAGLVAGGGQGIG